MGTCRKVHAEPAPQIPPAVTPDGQEARMIAYAMDLAEKQLREGTASSQVITHYLRLGTAREKLEREKLRKENELLTAKTESIRSIKEVGELYANAIEAMRRYSAHTDDDG